MLAHKRWALPVMGLLCLVIIPVLVFADSSSDGDRDGVADIKDRCPDTACGVKVDGEGCTLDSDNDTIVDRYDRCPQTPAGSKVDANGCTIPRKAQAVVMTATSADS